MTRRLPCPPAPGPLEAYAARFDDLFSTLAQRRGFREYLTGLLLPRNRNKTLTCLAGTEPVVGAQHPSVQRLQFFLSESTWDHERVNARRVELLLADPATAPSHGTWAYGKDAYTPVDAAHALTWTDPEHPGDWTAVGRTFP
ncbi:transposase [Streptomyces sp. NPDC056638]|uniref:transposase n=1 Tax=Streptomyces sp. NPDC056638 TaxID=3345887 RepID=UPI00368122FE